MPENTYHIMAQHGKWLVFVEQSSQADVALETKREAIEWCQRDALDCPGERILVYQGAFVDFEDEN